MISYDVIVIGAGSAGFSAALAARETGAKVCLIEKDKLGGECPNFACVPTKALLKAAKMYRMCREADRFGISGRTSADFGGAMAYRKSVVESITGGGERGERYVRLAKQNGITVVFGRAMFMDPSTVRADGRTFSAKTFVIAAGTEEFVPPIRGLSDTHYWTFKDAVMCDRPPKSLAVIGAGPVGSELATFFSAYGSRVVVLQSAPMILHREDPEIAALAQAELEAKGVQVVTDAKIFEVSNARGGVYGVRVEKKGERTTHAVDRILLAAGKRSNVDGLNLEAVGVRLNPRGSIVTDALGRTSARYIFAAGDADAGPMFTHTAHYEGAIAGRNAALLAKNKRSGFLKRDERVVPRVTFVDPEVASVGMTTPEVKGKYRAALVGRYRISSLGRAATEHVENGLVKIVAHPKTRKVLGVHIMSERAGEMIHEGALALYLNATVDKIASMIHAYPTFSEAMAAAAGSVRLED